jgi:hypothetical protein
MSEPKSIGQIIAELVSDPNSPVGQALLQCPCVKALLDAVGQDADSTNSLDDWIDNQDVMLALHISQRTLQTLRSNGTLPYSRINNKIYYRRRDVEKLLNDNYKMMKIHWHYGK